MPICTFLHRNFSMAFSAKWKRGAPFSSAKSITLTLDRDEAAPAIGGNRAN
jgi:hypothetical protein